MSAATKKKYVEQDLCENFSLLADGQNIVRITKSRGNNLHQVMDGIGEEFLVSMPPKFRKHVWVKRGDFVVTEPIMEGKKVKGEIVRILLKEHIRHLQENNQWPKCFELDNTCDEKQCLPKVVTEPMKEHCDESDDDDDLVENVNRPRVYVSETSSSESECESNDT